MIRFLHAADLHLDSAFSGLSGDQARLRRRESRRLLVQIKNYVNQNDIPIVLLAGDLFDGEETYPETLEELSAVLKGTFAQVFIAPGNHDCCAARSPYTAMEWPENVHIFRTGAVERVELPELGCAVYGAGFTAPNQDTSLLEGFTTVKGGFTKLMVLHADLDAGASPYNPITSEEVAGSGLDYLALGHRHSFSGLQYCGGTAWAYPGCAEGRGFDETGAKGFIDGTIEEGKVDITFVPSESRRYEVLRLDVSDTTPAEALRAAVPETALRDLYRVVFTGETDERGVDCAALLADFAEKFYHLELRDETRLRQDVWAAAGQDSLRGLFLRALRQRWESGDAAERELAERAARFGLAALDGRDV